jgi:hypothetical protein
MGGIIEFNGASQVFCYMAAIFCGLLGSYVANVLRHAEGRAECKTDHMR